jgi:hypothetical protein
MIGMLWFDNSKERMDVKISKAAAYYHDKYGGVANVCYVSAGEQEIEAPEGIEVKVTKTVIKNHFWLGIETRER